MFISDMIAELSRRINRWSVPVSHCSFICCCYFLFHANFARCPNFKRQRGAILIGDRSISKSKKSHGKGQPKNETCVACGCFFCPSQGALSASKIRSQAHSALHPRMVTKRVEPSKGFVSLLWWQNFWISTKSGHATDANMAEEKRKNWHVWQFLCMMISSLRSRRLGVVGTRKNGRARRGLTPCVSPSRAPVLSFAHFFQAPATQARWFQSGTKRKPVTLLLSFDNANGHLWVISVKQDCWDPEIWLPLWRDITLLPSIVRITEVSIHE